MIFKNKKVIQQVQNYCVETNIPQYHSGYSIFNDIYFLILDKENKIFFDFATDYLIIEKGPTFSSALPCDESVFNLLPIELSRILIFNIDCIIK